MLFANIAPSCQPPPMAERKGFVPRRKPKGKPKLTLTALFAYIAYNYMLFLPLSISVAKSLIKHVAGCASPLRYFVLTARRPKGGAAIRSNKKGKVLLPFLFSLRLQASRRQWRRGRDSNPCGVSPKRFSRPPRYDRFDTSPFVSGFPPNGFQDRLVMTASIPLHL